MPQQYRVIFALSILLLVVAFGGFSKAVLTDEEFQKYITNSCPSKPLDWNLWQEEENELTEIISGGHVDKLPLIYSNGLNNLFVEDDVWPRDDSAAASSPNPLSPFSSTNTTSPIYDIPNFETLLSAINTTKNITEIQPNNSSTTSSNSTISSSNSSNSSITTASNTTEISTPLIHQPNISHPQPNVINNSSILSKTNESISTPLNGTGTANTSHTSPTSSQDQLKIQNEGLNFTQILSPHSPNTSTNSSFPYSGSIDQPKENSQLGEQKNSTHLQPLVPASTQTQQTGINGQEKLPQGPITNPPNSTLRATNNENSLSAGENHVNRTFPPMGDLFSAKQPSTNASSSTNTSAALQHQTQTDKISEVNSTPEKPQSEASTTSGRKAKINTAPQSSDIGNIIHSTQQKTTTGSNLASAPSATTQNAPVQITKITGTSQPASSSSAGNPSKSTSSPPNVVGSSSSNTTETPSTSHNNKPGLTSTTTALKPSSQEQLSKNIELALKQLEKDIEEKIPSNPKPDFKKSLQTLMNDIKGDEPKSLQQSDSVRCRSVCPKRYEKRVCKIPLHQRDSSVALEGNVFNLGVQGPPKVDVGLVVGLSVAGVIVLILCCCGTTITCIVCYAKRKRTNFFTIYQAKNVQSLLEGHLPERQDVVIDNEDDNDEPLEYQKTSSDESSNEEDYVGTSALDETEFVY
ncbi:hypothetical protein C9374_008402 [Naegleria lovaniensis]|uniref:Uncharacterized protein n=1 Tax=Naegleria lovaniensis TaxID=51637 RepID=A0AA88GIT5_NAELO|nr:uncharacterized protein C9374_008402 [Naegleria lovaniensis]KAG2378259.1 hypothetical protein C9374_008402 [Naegleria lovaniensis]